MPSFVQPLITDAGIAAALAAQANGLRLQITHVQLGSALYTLNDAPGSPDYARTALVTPVESNTIAGGYANENRFRVDFIFLGTNSPYAIGEIGFWAGDPNAGGTLFAIWAQATPFAQRTNLDYLATFNLAIARVPADAVTVQVDPELYWSISLIADHEAAQNPHPQYRLRGGFEVLIADRVITAADEGKVFMIQGSGINITFPVSTVFQPGADITLLCTSASSFNLLGSNFVSSGGKVISSVVGYSAIINPVSTTDMYRVAHTGSGRYFIDNPGYEIHANGLIVQWGNSASITLTNNAEQTGSPSVTWPIAFPNSVLKTIVSNSSPRLASSLGNISLTGADVSTAHVGASGASGTGSANYLVYGF